MAEHKVVFVGTKKTYFEKFDHAQDACSCFERLKGGKSVLMIFLYVNQRLSSVFTSPKHQAMIESLKQHGA